MLNVKRRPKILMTIFISKKHAQTCVQTIPAFCIPNEDQILLQTSLIYKIYLLPHFNICIMGSCNVVITVHSASIAAVFPWQDV